MENGAFAGANAPFSIIFSDTCMIFQRPQKAFLWSRGLYRQKGYIGYVAIIYGSCGSESRQQLARKLKFPY